MAVEILIQLINIIENLFVWMVIINIILSYVLDPYHPVRQTIANILAPLLDPIRRVVPLVGMFDFSPLILIILLQVVSSLLISFLRAL
ncbi:MAG: hypothetical protein Kow002_17050 [Anaerolineales bacterium]